MSDENCAAAANVNRGQLRRGKTIEQIYQKKTALEHILLRPDTYVGSTEHQLQDMWIFDDVKQQMVHRKIDYVPALYKIFDEILVNAADNSMRDPVGMNLIDVTIDREQGSVSVMNNGQGVPVQIHKEHQIYVPELIFGHLLTSDNYDDGEKKVTGGRNGYGAKLTNVFSKKCIIETADKNVKKKFRQVYERNMSQKGVPEVTNYTGSDYTRLTFWPDFARFGMTGLDSDIVGLMMKRAYDIAASTSKKVRVVLNGNQLPIKCFEDYIHMFIEKRNGETPPPVIYERCNPRWEVAMSLTDGSFQQVSFVNSISTIKGGTHVTHVSDQMVEAIMKVVKSKNRGGIEIKPAHIKNHLMIFINCLVENPAFDSQTKETLTTKQSRFGTSCEISDGMMKQILKSGVVETILDWVKAKEKVDISRKLRTHSANTLRVMGVPKLEDANDAGGKHSDDCTLILTEGDSAKSLAVAGLSIIGRDKYGVFPLKGKVLNVRDANFKQVTGNAEIQNILKIMGLDLKSEYNSTKGLRYASVMLMTDQDHDGSHIKGLLMNLFHCWWPSLVRMDGFLKQFITPIVKVWKGGEGNAERKNERSFFTLTEFDAWKKSTDNGRGWKSKYYKGLGTSTMKEAKEYFRDLEVHERKFKWNGDRDGELIDLAFNKKRADDRKEWINGYVEGSHVNHSLKTVPYSDFINKELVQYAKYDVSRSIPSLVDGFKPSQRKVLFCSFKKKLKNDIKVAQFVGYISEQSAYHHGETSLEGTIISLAQNFVGSNNVNLLVPSGQFGTRLQGGKDHAASRYIYTRLQNVTRTLFHPDDDHILSYLNEEGLSIEPYWYCPTLPTVLVNGADGIGVGWSTFIPNFNPRDIIHNIRRLLRGLGMEEMRPWYKGYKGSIEKISSDTLGRFEVTGCIAKTGPNTLEITELPLKKWTQDYKEMLEGLMPEDTGKKGDSSEDTSIIDDFREYHTESTVHFVVTLSRDKMAKAEAAGLDKTFKIKTSVSLSNMVLFDSEGKICKYESALDILREFCRLRYGMYGKRKGYLVAKMTRDKEILSNKARFILMVVKGELEIRKKKKDELLRELKQLRFTPMSELDAILEKASSKGRPAESAGNAVGDDGEKVEKTEYDYLLNMNLWSLTFERVEEIKKQLETKTEELKVLEATTLETMWDKDLQALSEALDELDAQDDSEAAAATGAAQSRKKKARTGATGLPPPSAQPTQTPAQRAEIAARRKAAEELTKRSLASIAGDDGLDKLLGAAVQKTTWTPGERVATSAKSSVEDLTTGSTSGAPKGPGRLQQRLNFPETQPPEKEKEGVTDLTASASSNAKLKLRRPAKAAETVQNAVSVEEPPSMGTPGAAMLARLMSKAVAANSSIGSSIAGDSSPLQTPYKNAGAAKSTATRLPKGSEDLFAFMDTSTEPGKSSVAPASAPGGGRGRGRGRPKKTAKGHQGAADSSSSFRVEHIGDDSAVTLDDDDDSEEDRAPLLDLTAKMAASNAATNAPTRVAASIGGGSAGGLGSLSSFVTTIRQPPPVPRQPIHEPSGIFVDAVASSASSPKLLTPVQPLPAASAAPPAASATSPPAGLFGGSVFGRPPGAASSSAPQAGSGLIERAAPQRKQPAPKRRKTRRVVDDDSDGSDYAEVVG